MGLDYYIDRGGDVWLKGDLSPNGISVYLVKKQSGNTPNASKIFPDLFDDFMDTSLNTNLWSTATSGTGSSISEVGGSNPYLSVSSSAGTALLTGKKWFQSKTIDYIFSIVPRAIANRIRFHYAQIEWGIFNSGDVFWGASYASPNVTLLSSNTYRLSETLNAGVNYKINIKNTNTNTNIYSNNTNVPASASLWTAQVLTGDTGATTAGSTVKLANIFAREYADSEPTVTVIDETLYYKIVVKNNTNTWLRGYQFSFNGSSIGGCTYTESLEIIPSITPSNYNVDLFKDCEYYFDFSNLQINESMSWVTDIVNDKIAIISGATLTTNTAGQTNRAYQFDGINDKILGTSNALNISGDFSILIVCNIPTSNTTTMDLLCSRGTSDNRGFDIGIKSGNKLYFGIDSGPSYYDLSLSTKTYTGKVCLMAVREGATQYLYAFPASDGQAWWASRQTSSDSLTNGANTLFGCNYSGNGNYFNGKIETVVAWKKSLKDDAFSLLYAFYLNNMYPTQKGSTQSGY